MYYADVKKNVWLGYDLYAEWFSIQVSFLGHVNKRCVNVLNFMAVMQRRCAAALSLFLQRVTNV